MSGISVIYPTGLDKNNYLIFGKKILKRPFGLLIKISCNIRIIPTL
jgi:hypothetical protein